ncbi:MAG: cation:proton antiporter [Patescibacteria group bacterium]
MWKKSRLFLIIGALALPIMAYASGGADAGVHTGLSFGTVAGKANKWIVGFGMVPRGEVGLIFAMIGKTLGVIDERMFSVIVIMVIVTTLLTPPLLSMLLKKQK